jgi:hypothetical protein
MFLSFHHDLPWVTPIAAYVNLFLRMTTKSNLPQMVAIGLVLLLVVVLLRAEGRMFICSCGHFAVWTSDTCSSNTSQQLLDPYSFTHVLHGFLFFWLIALLFRRMNSSWQVCLALLLEGAWELFENTRFVIDKYRTETAALGYTGDTIVNSLGDLTCAFAGFMIARSLGLRRSLIVFVVVEVVLIVWLRDSLLLQILMLVHPVEAIKLWQMCVQP